MNYCRFFLIIFIMLANLVFANEPVNFSNAPAELPYLIKAGDWIFRKGIQTDSFIVNQLGGGDFSHIGMVISIEPKIKIIHATTSDDENHLNQVIVSSLEEFITPELAEKYAIARPNFLSEVQKQNIVDDLLTKKGQAFVLAPREQPHLYCTTLLFDSIIKFQPDFNIEWKNTYFPSLSGSYLFPSAFANYSDITWIYKYPEKQ
ncbi:MULTISPECIES: hypothetical protein [unclassified Gilliamella]|uniref:hypothetical protein n=1 Tax=unclassified Gilliamella TaxID=2685620 RepID=UPI001323CCF6|nr:MULTISPECIES: hypothetical protein [unclassified Gilliamella]MWN30884.1 hypothetical protein [Gilliamella sp. Pra-s60]MWP28551.1 hypothetical protein [Gilliamella sp. Pra-s54]